MTAFFVSRVTIKDTEKMQNYAQLASKSMQPYGGDFIMKGLADMSITGQLTHQVTSIVGFPNIQNLRDWASSGAYQALIELRDEAGEFDITAYSSPE